jgi:hypothetical protein
MLFALDPTKPLAPMHQKFLEPIIEAENSHCHSDAPDDRIARKMCSGSSTKKFKV